MLRNLLWFVNSRNGSLHEYYLHSGALLTYEYYSHSGALLICEHYLHAYRWTIQSFMTVILFYIDRNLVNMYTRTSH